jgi:uncharacterized protein YggE
MKPFIQLAFLLFAATLAAAQSQTPQTPPKFVRVVGTAEVKVTPDQAMIEIGVQKQDATAALAMRAASVAASKVLAALRANGVAEKDIQTTFLSLRPVSETHKGVKTSYFVAEQTMSVLVRDLGKVEPLLQLLLNAGGNRISSIEYETSEPRKYRDQARDLAVKAAREKAKALAAALSQDIGKAQSIEETDYPDSGGLRANASYEFRIPTKLAGPSIAAGQKTITAAVSVSFELI